MLDCQSIEQRADLFREEWCECLEFADIPFVKGEKEFLNPVMGSIVESVQYRMHQL